MPSLVKAHRKTGPVARWAQYLALRAVAGVMSLIGVRLSLTAAACLGSLMFRFVRKHRQRAINHVRLAFPGWGAARRVEVAKQSFQFLAQLAVEAHFVPKRIDRRNYERHLVRKNPQPGLSMLFARQPMVMISGHLGNWEALGYLLSVEGHAIQAVARPLDNPLINDWLLRQRRRRGMEVIEKWDSANVRIVEALQSNHAVGFIADQNGGDKGLFVPYFGRLASTKKSVALLAINLNVPILCGSARRIEKHRLKYEIELAEIIHPQDWADKQDPIYYVTARFVHAIESMVRQHPEQYFWMHRRWKSRPAFERAGKPMPESLKRKLRELEWVDDALMDELGKPLGYDPQF